MAGQGPLLKSLARLVSGFDNGAWEALANKGLARRAQKDLESGLNIEIEEDSDAVHFQIPPHRVTMPAAGPAKATCTCPARGVCQHILAAGMWLQKIPMDDGSRTCAEPANPTTSHEQIETEMLAFTMEQLEKWAGVAAVREARSLIMSGKIDRETTGTLGIHFQEQGIQTRYVRGGGLDGIIVSGAARNHQQAAAVAAVLCVHLAHGRIEKETAAESKKVLAEAEEAPRTRSEVLIAVQMVLQEAVQVGLAHVSNSLKERLQTLGMSAQAVNLPRLSRMLRALADETNAIIHRQGRASEAGLLLAMARTYALTHALKRPEAKTRAELIGVHRTQYQELARLNLYGAAAYPWQTPSGYMGLTVLYWDPQNKTWLSWTDARPSNQAMGFDPMKRFGGTGPWEGMESPEESARSKIALINPKRNPDGRLSSSSSTKAMTLGLVSPSEFDFGSRLFADWSVLREYITRVFPLGLREVRPLDLIVVLEPRHFGQRRFDEQRQLFHWEIQDQEGRSFLLVIPFREWTRQTINYLENLKPSAGAKWRFVVKIFSSEMGLAGEPLALHRLDSSGEAILHLAFTDEKKTHQSKSSVIKAVLDVFQGTDDDDDWSEGEDENPETGIPRLLENILSRIEKEIERAAESGANALNTPALTPIKKEAEKLGLTPLIKALDGPAKQPIDQARMILAVRYICSLYRQSASFAA